MCISLCDIWDFASQVKERSVKWPAVYSSFPANFAIRISKELSLVLRYVRFMECPSVFDTKGVGGDLFSSLWKKKGRLTVAFIRPIGQFCSHTSKKMIENSQDDDFPGVQHRGAPSFLPVLPSTRDRGLLACLIRGQESANPPSLPSDPHPLPPFLPAPFLFRSSRSISLTPGHRPRVQMPQTCHSLFRALISRQRARWIFSHTRN